MRPLVALSMILTTMTAVAQTTDFSSYPVYGGSDLGLHYTASASSFRIWSPPSDSAELVLYVQGTGGTAMRRISMQRTESGTWTARIEGDLRGMFYAFRVRIGGRWGLEVPDPYARLVGTNGRRAVIGDDSASNPVGWAKDTPPAFSGKTGGMASATDAVIYELHVRDATIHPSSGARSKGKFLGLAERGTRSPEGESTGLDHLQELGVTHVHLLPSYDFSSVDESRPDSAQYNWGYDPLNYNAPEGSYSTDPSDGITRLREFKQLVQAFHRAGLRVVMDVVYNHTMTTGTSSFDQLVPGYYYRQRADGGYSNASACGNETASERPMMRKFMLESLLYWVEHCHVDGFRFDLMGIHDIETMNLISRRLHQVKPDILLYGEGWTAGSSPLPDSLRAIKRNAYRLDGIAVFSDDLRDGIKGSVFEHAEKGFASGRTGMEQTIRFGTVASTLHPQVDYGVVNYSKAPYASDPTQVVSYCECHDNHNLHDKLAISAPEADARTREEMQRLAMTIVLTSQGIPFLHAGSEFLRTKKGVENSFQSPDSVNAIDWSLKSQHKDFHRYIAGLVRMRRTHAAFRMRRAVDLRANLRFLEGLPAQVVGYRIRGEAVGDRWKDILVLFNGGGDRSSIALPDDGWKTFVSGNRLVDGVRASGSHELKAHSATILYRE
jgi:pullulanase